MIIDHPKPSQLSALRALWQEAFGDTDCFLNAFARTAFSPDRCLTAEEAGRPLAALYWFDCLCRGRPVAYVYAVATSKAFRGQGICHRLMEQLHRLLSQRGYAGALLVPGEEALTGFYEAMGYRVCCHRQELICASGKKPVTMHPVNAEAYARLRRKKLPEGGVVQEGENLAFLATQAQLYAGEGFVLAARKEGNRLLAMELLGDVDAAPGILKALGCEEGCFPAFGAGSPFAMYLPLTDAPAPTYFAFAFD